MPSRQSHNRPSGDRVAQVQRQTARIDRHIEDHRHAHLPDASGNGFVKTEITVFAATERFQVERRETGFWQVAVALIIPQHKQFGRCGDGCAAAIPYCYQRQHEATGWLT